MSTLKTSATPSEPSIPAEKEFQLAKQQAEMNAGEALFREASQKIIEQREKEQSGDTDTDQNQPKDTAQLSDVHSRPRADAAGLSDKNLQWILEMAGKDWEAFFPWQPEPGMSLPAQLQELSRLYLSLLEAALKYAEGENLAWQLEYLDALLAQKLNAVIEKNLQQLTILLEKTGNTTAMDSIRSSLYKQTAGQNLSPQAAHRLFAQISPAGAGNIRPFPAASSSFSGKSTGNPLGSQQNSRLQQTYSRQPSAASSSFSGEGMIYQSSRKQNIRFQQVYHGQQNSWKEQIRQRKEIISNSTKGLAENTFRQAGLVSCSGKELEMADRFAAHLNGRGNLFQNPDISARNDEVIGLLAAIMSIKGQVYTGEVGRTSFLTLNLQNAIDKLIDAYLSRKGITNVYYHTLAVYKKIRNPQKAIQAGQDYAYQRFREKQANPSGQKSAPYAKESGFFRALLKNLSPEKELALGTHILQKDWENFLRALKTIPKSSYTSRAERYSPWGILLVPGTHHTGSSKTILNVFLGIAVFILIAVLAALFLGLGR